MELFDTSAVIPSKLGPKDYAESVFQFLETSGRTAFVKIRRFLEGWFSLYPDDEKAKLRSSFRAKEGVESPLFELALYNVFHKMGAEIQIHPAIEGTGNKPDFHIRLKSGFEFYLEAIVVRGVSDKDVVRENMEQNIYGIIDHKLKSPEFFLSVHVLARGVNVPSENQLISDLSNHLSSISHVKAVKDYAENGHINYDEVYTFVWEHKGWKIEFVPLPKTEEAIGKSSHRPIGAIESGVVYSTTKEDIRNAVEFKIKHHKKVTKPIIIAVNSTHWSTDEEDFRNALYGSIIVSVDLSSRESHAYQDTDGVWRNKKELRNQNLIAVIGAQMLTHTTLASQNLVVYQNPYIPYPDEAKMELLSHVFPEPETKLGRTDGSTLGEIFGLPSDWLQDDVIDD
ncbi:hypothetical protein LBMAG21_10130 [Armatimonadota bacterium]|nr:hypothetical protein LBMAG21_10130 [Armatimonadota bacterium]